MRARDLVPLRERGHFTTGEVAGFLGTYTEKLIRWAKAGKVKTLPTKGKMPIRIPVEEVERLLKQFDIRVPGIWPKEATILLVDDDPRVCRIVPHYFRMHHVPVDVEVFLTVEEALERLKHSPQPRLVVLDWNFKGGSKPLQAKDAIRRMAMARETRSIPIILMSATDPNTAKEAVREYGLVDFILKPLKLEAFKDRIWVHLFGYDQREGEGEERRRMMELQIPK